MQSIGVRERFDLNAKMLLKYFLGTDDFAFQPGKTDAPGKPGQ
jgi:hypothetical protein